MNSKEQIKFFYSTVAEEYATHFKDEMKNKPLDCKFLDLFIERINEDASIYELGCGSGEISRYVNSKGREIIGTDLSLEMVKNAQILNPNIQFEVADVLSLQYDDNSIGGIIAFYMIVNFSLEDIQIAFNEIYRVLEKNGWLLFSFHSKSESGDQIIHADEFLGKSVSLDFYFFKKEDISQILKSSGFEVVEEIVRTPYKDVEYQSERTYIFAKKH